MATATVSHSNSWYRVVIGKSSNGPFRFAAAVEYLKLKTCLSPADARDLVLEARDNGHATTETE